MLRAWAGFGVGLFLVMVACGDHGAHDSWRTATILRVRAAQPPISEYEYPPFSEGIFPCSRCHEGGGTPNASSSFAHALHIGEGLGCEDCHMPDGGTEPKPASAEFCLECHEEPAEGSEGVRAYFARVRDSNGEYVIPSVWASDELRDHHTAHATAKVECATCHGEPVNGPMVRPKSVPLMEACVACHEERKVADKCETCHSRITAPQHAAIELHHAEEQRDCYGCHNPADRDRLRLANGRTLRFESSYLLCGQCHGPKLRDWRDGLHGKRTGEWGGKRKYLLCVHCHNPHEPRIQPMPALPRPPRPEEIR